MLSKRTFLLACLAAVSSRAFALPTRPITISAPFAPGASSDGIARILSTYLSDSLKRTMIVDNRPGAGGTLSLIALSKASPDGATFGIGATGGVTINPHVAGAQPFDPLKELTAVAKLVDIPLVLVSAPDSSLRTINDVVTKSKGSPQGLDFATGGVNSSQHLTIEVLKQRTGANLVHVPYRGSAPAVTAVLGGQASLASVDLTSAIEHIRAGTLVAVGITTAHRYYLAPDIPTFAEQGLKDFDITGWLGMFAPKGIDPAILDEMSAALEAALKDRNVVAGIERLACAPSFAGPEPFSAFIKRESDKMKGIVELVATAR